MSGSLVLEILANEGVRVVDGSGNDVPKANLIGEGKVIGVYVSAHWCPPCRGFTPKLAEFYNQRPDRGDTFNIVFISCDRDKKSFADYFGTMPWYALDFEDKDNQDTIKSALGVTGIPQFTLLDASSGDIIQQNARQQVMGNAPNFPWR